MPVGNKECTVYGLLVGSKERCNMLTMVSLVSVGQYYLTMPSVTVGNTGIVARLRGYAPHRSLAVAEIQNPIRKVVPF